MQARTVAVVGAGIGGLSAALALGARGFAVTLIERRTRLAEIGAGLQLSPNAGRILDGLGLGPALSRVASEPERVVVRRLDSGRRVGAVALGSFMRERFGAPYRVVLRADLHTILLDVVRSRPEVRLVVGRSVTGVEARPEAAIVALENASGVRETLAADAVIGADGLRSAVRAAMGDARGPVFCGYTAWRTVLSRQDAPPPLGDRDTGLWLGRSCHVVHYPVASGRLVNVVVVVAGPEPSGESPGTGEAAALRAALARAAAPLSELVARAPEWSAWPLYDLAAARMAKGRIALLGDAAHPVLPFLAQGASLAIEDAAVLAACLGRESDPRSALAEYAELRRPRARKVQRRARRNGRLYHAGWATAFVRDLAMRSLGERGMTERYAWLYGWRPEGPSAGG